MGKSVAKHCSEIVALSLVKFISIKNDFSKKPAGRSGKEIVSAACHDSPPNEFAHGRRFGQNDTRINIRGVRFAASDMRLINQ